MDESLSVENRILLCCARRDGDPDALGALVDLGARLQHGVDWEALLAAARRHGLLPLLYERLVAVAGGRVPPDVTARLRGAYAANLLRNRRLAAELAEVVGALRIEGMEAIVLKGGALAPTVYANPAQRPMADLDLLVRPEDVDRAGAVLESLDFHMLASMPDHVMSFQKRFGGGFDWCRSRGGKTTYLDIHHRLVRVGWCQAAFPIEPDALWAAVRPLTLDGTAALQLSVEDTIIHLCLHPALNHGYACPLLSYVDVDRVITAADGTLSWSRLVEQVERFGVKTAVYRNLKCAQDLLETPVPPEVLGALEPSSWQLRILWRMAPLDPKTVLQRVGGSRDLARQALLDAALADGIQGSGGVMQALLFPDEEWLAARYGLGRQGQVRLYRLVHPLYVGWVGLRGLHRMLFEHSLAGRKQTKEYAAIEELNLPTWSVDEHQQRT